MTERERPPDRGLKASSPGTNGYGEDQQSDKSTRPASCNDLATFRLPWTCSSRPGISVSSATRSNMWSLISVGPGGRFRRECGGHDIFAVIVEDRGNGVVRVGDLAPVRPHDLIGGAAKQDRVGSGEPIGVENATQLVGERHQR
jgi:hypothetical protein